MSLKKVSFKVKEGGSVNRGFLMTRERGRKTKEVIWAKISELSPKTILEMDFSNIKFMDVSGADEVVVKITARLEAGECPDRFIVLSHVDLQHKENIETALKVNKKAVIVKEDGNWYIWGYLTSSDKEIIHKITEKGSMTAREIQEEMNYKTVNEASTKLGLLYKKCLIAREPYREAVVGGGRQFRYISLI